MDSDMITAAYHLIQTFKTDNLSLILKALFILENQPLEKGVEDLLLLWREAIKPSHEDTSLGINMGSVWIQNGYESSHIGVGFDRQLVKEIK